MKPRIIAEMERIAGDRLTPEMREEIALCAVRIMEDVNRKATLAAMEKIKEVTRE